MKSVLIVTQKSDPHSDAVLQAIEGLGGTVLRLNTETYLSSYNVHFEVGADRPAGFHISDSHGRSVSSSALTSCYYRKPVDVLPHPDLSESGAKQFSANEGEAALNFLYTLPGMTWVNDPFANRRAQVKFGQLEIARTVGLRVPASVITNDPMQATQFAERHDYRVLCKTLKTNAIKVSEQLLHTFSYRLNSEEVKHHIESVRFAPTLLQEYVEKDIELRINIIGSSVFATSIHSQELPETMIDWRKSNPWNLKHEPFTLPPGIASALLRIVQHYGLHFAAIDMIKTPTGDFVFLEINPNGQWYWIEQITGMKLSMSIANYLMK